MLRRRPPPIISRKMAALFAILMALAFAPLLVPIPGFSEELSPGDLAPRDLIARRSVQFDSEVQTEAARRNAEEAVSDVVTIDIGVVQDQRAQIEALFDQVDALFAQENLTAEERVNALIQNPPGDQLTPTFARTLISLNAADREAAREAALAATDGFLETPVTTEEIPGAITEFLAERGGLEAPVADAVSGVLATYTRENFVVDEEATEENRQVARDNVSPVTVTLTRGQTIVSAGTPLTAASIEQLREGGVIDDVTAQAADWAAGGLLAVGSGLLLGVYLYHFQPVTGRALRRLIVVGVVTAGVLVMARLTIPELLPDTERRYWAFALPIPTAAMLAASLLELRFSVVLGIIVGMLVPFIATTASDIVAADFEGPVQALELGAVYVVGGLAGAAAVHRADRLGRYGLGGIAVGLSTFTVLLVFWLLEKEFGERSLGWIAIAASINGIGSAIITVGVFVLLSNAFGVTTRLQLMELAQTDHPLLSRLQEEAPGTFQHAMLVGNLAERAARSIGADALVTRVGAYYHDIGKLEQPEYYVENQLDLSQTPHGVLSPQESAERIIAHVTNGVALARKHHLPQLIIDFIPQHHGTRLVAFFYRKAMEANGEVAQDRFRYSGPRPQSKEAALVMLADSCEALVRSEKDASDVRIGELVDSVFAERLAEGQLDECDITLRDVQQVAASFKATFRAIYHPRIAYPAPRPEELAALAGAEIARPPSDEAAGG